MCGDTTCWPSSPRSPRAASTGSIRWSGWPRENSARSANAPATTPCLVAAWRLPITPDTCWNWLAGWGSGAVLGGTRRWPETGGWERAGVGRGLVGRGGLADAPAMAETGDLEEGVRALLDGGRDRTPLSRRLAATVAALACALVLPVALVTVHAQAGRGALAGVVQDASQMHVPGCEVRVKNLDGKNEEVANASVYGEFAFASIPVGRYSVEARSQGFAVGKAEVLVEAGRRAEVVVTLPLGQITEAMTIRGSRPGPCRGRSSPP